MSDTIPILVVEKNRLGEKALVARGMGWPNEDEPAKLNQHFVEEMRRLKEKIDIESHEPETKVAEMAIRRPDHDITSVGILTTKDS
jgi:hypothetical protein